MICDHLPIFLTYDCQIKRKKKENSCRFARVRTDEAINTFKNDLLREVWRGVYVEEVNDAYEAFRKIYLSLYDSYCPIIQCKYKRKYDAKPWITKGLLNACKKKNKLYKDFIKYKTKAAERQYKVYKNKLTMIMRQVKKE